MMNMPDQSAATDQDSAMEWEKYVSFIDQIDLKGVWLVHSSVTNHHGPQTPGPAEMQIGTRPAWEPQDDGFRVRQQYTIRLAHEDDVFLDAIVVFGVDYASDMPMDEQLFDSFASTNLPLNTWPYLRQYLVDVMGRLNWAPYTLPAYKLSLLARPPVGDQPAES